MGSWPDPLSPLRPVYSKKLSQMEKSATLTQIQNFTKSYIFVKH